MNKKIIGIDIGGTSIKLGLFDTEGVLLDKWQIATNLTNNGENISNELIVSIREKLKSNQLNIEDILGIGLGVPGPVNGLLVNRAVNLGWSEFPLGEMLEKEFNLPIALLNDANAAALGELWQGAGRKLKDIIFVTIGTGVGGGIVIDGKIINGSHSSGGEIGHIPVFSTEKRTCGCGNVNCLECFGSANGMIKTMNDLSNDVIVDNTKDIFDLAKQNNMFAKKAIEITIDYLARGLSGLLNTLDPEALVIGGGVSEAGSAFLTPLKEALDGYVFPQIRGDIKLFKADLGNDAGIYGAAYQIINMIEVKA